ncbi:methyltransferase [Catenovulum sp. 2E275]|uniref:methyltransferase n=1 Tax=Catenovulum sp. 2E275 TaxID=2980497 RepID=UPI0021D1D1BD|nr:methyltransferase [Catenovulum sp. 2E275]MCU4674912.1 methyltransferase [Catenovulum sp. 2E275]
MQNNHLLNLPNQTSLTLWRYPQQAVDSALQAWDSADVLLAKKFIEQSPLTTSPAIINDQFGAISCQLAEFTPLIYQDSKVSQLATLANFSLNGLPIQADQFTSQLNQVVNQAVYLIKIPKNLDYLEAILAHLHSNAADDLKLIASAKANHINKSVVKLFNRYFSQVDVSLAEKKSRTISASIKQKSPYSSFNPLQQWQAPSGLTFSNAANVFSRSSLDIGAAFMLEHLPNVSGKQVIDLACGNGVLGVHLLTQHPQSMIFSDDCYQAIQSAKINVEQNFPDLSGLTQFAWQDCLTEQTAQSADIIICNPPFHQQHTITDHIAKQMFSDAHRVLKPAGELYIVGNRHLGYHQLLSNLFGQCSVIASNAKFVIIKAIK